MSTRQLVCTLAATLLVAGLSASAQVPITCHIQTFTPPAGSKVASIVGGASINRWGNIVGNDVNDKPFIRYTDGRIQPMHINIPNANAIVQKRNAAGVTVGRAEGSPWLGFVNSGSTTTTFSAPGSASTEFTGINRYGTIVGNTGAEFGGIFKIKDGKFSMIQVPTEFSREIVAHAISDTGVIVGNYAENNGAPIPDLNIHGFILRNGQFQDLTYPTGSNTYLFDINATGLIVGELDGPEDNVSFLYKDGTFYAPTFLLPDGSVLNGRGVYVQGVNGYGQMTGRAYLGGTTYGGFLAHCDF